MSISVKTHKILWGRAANRCSICLMELVMDASETDDESVVGEACHIVAHSPDGPRGESELTEEQRDKYSNLILLCSVHHKQIDDQPDEFHVEKLKQIKLEHEKLVREKFDYDPAMQRDDEVYAGYLEEWESRLNIKEWDKWASSILFGGQPSLSDEYKTALEDIRPWLLSRLWPGRYPQIEGAFVNFRLVAQDFCLVFSKYAEKRGVDWETKKFYQIEDWDPERYETLLNRYEYHVALVEDLILELTRAANYICDAIRNELMRSYRITEGVLLIVAGPLSDFTYKTYRAEYRGEERIENPYPGLEAFKSLRFERDWYFGDKPAN